MLTLFFKKPVFSISGEAWSSSSRELSNRVVFVWVHDITGTGVVGVLLLLTLLSLSGSWMVHWFPDFWLFCTILLILLFIPWYFCSNTWIRLFLFFVASSTSGSFSICTVWVSTHLFVWFVIVSVAAFGRAESYLWRLLVHVVFALRSSLAFFLVGVICSALQYRMLWFVNITDLWMLTLK